MLCPFMHLLCITTNYLGLICLCLFTVYKFSAYFSWLQGNMTNILLICSLSILCLISFYLVTTLFQSPKMFLIIFV